MNKIESCCSSIRIANWHGASTPVGGLEYGEQPEQGVIREFYEESGMTIEVERLLFADSSKYDHHVSLIYLCRHVIGEFRDSHEVSEMNYFPVDDLPPMLFDEKDLIRGVHATLFQHELA